MPKYRKKPVIIEAVKWEKHGDHPEVEYLDIDKYHTCPQCGENMQDHGWIDTLEGGHRVCPGDFVITGVQDENYPCKPAIFHETYEKV